MIALGHGDKPGHSMSANLLGVVGISKRDKQVYGDLHVTNAFGVASAY